MAIYGDIWLIWQTLGHVYQRFERATTIRHQCPQSTVRAIQYGGQGSFEEVIIYYYLYSAIYRLGRSSVKIDLKNQFAR